MWTWYQKQLGSGSQYLKTVVVIGIQILVAWTVRSCVLNFKWQSFIFLYCLYSARWPRQIAELWTLWVHSGQVESGESGNLWNRITEFDFEYLSRRKNSAKEVGQEQFLRYPTWAAQSNRCLPISDIHSGLAAAQPVWLPVSLILWNLVCWSATSI